MGLSGEATFNLIIVVVLLVTIISAFAVYKWQLRKKNKVMRNLINSQEEQEEQIGNNLDKILRERRRESNNRNAIMANWTNLHKRLNALKL